MVRAIERATRADVLHVASRMRERDFIEFRALSPLDDRAALAEALAGKFGGRPDVLCGAVDGVPICIGGTLELWPGVMTLLFFATDDFPRIGRLITRWIKNDLFPRYDAAGVHRIQAISLDGYDDVHRWLVSLGLERETAPMRGYGKRGEDFVQFARLVKEAPRVRPSGDA